MAIQGILQLTPVGPYPLPQPVMSSAEISKPSAESAEVYMCAKYVINVTTKPVTHHNFVEAAEA